jgi:uncharacterized membrane protein YfcA
MDPRYVLLAALALVALGFLGYWAAMMRRDERRGALTTPRHVGIGFFTNFLDTLGIGSFATTTTLYRLWRLVPDEIIPGTLNVGHAAATFTQAFIYTTIVEVEFTTLVLMIGSAVAGSWLGAAIVAGLPRREIQRGMGLALLAAAVLMALTALNQLPGGGEALALSGTRLVVGLGINFLLGALMTIGIGAYAPIMILVSLLGMNPIAAFPIMMGSCAFLMPVASAQFIRKRKYDARAALGLAFGGVPAVVLAANNVRSLPLAYVRWLVVVVVVYAALSLLRSAMSEPRQVQSTAA